MAMMYDQILPFLKCFHLTLCSHMMRRNKSGWKIQELEWIGRIESSFQSGKHSRDESDYLISNIIYDPHDCMLMIKPVPRFHACLEALSILSEPMKVPVFTIRSKRVYFLLYGCAGASGSGVGSFFRTKRGVYFKIGTWEEDVEDNSSN